jgi:hypothetical protein
MLKAHGIVMIAMVLALCLGIDLGLAYLMGKPNGEAVVAILGVGFNQTQIMLCVLALSFFFWKAFGLSHARNAWRDGRRSAAGFAIVLFACALSFSVALELSWYQQTIANQASWAAEIVSDRKADTKRIEFLEAKLAERERARPVTEVQADIEAIYAKLVGAPTGRDSVGNMTRKCSDARSPAYTHCARHADLVAELKQGETHATYLAELRQLRKTRQTTEAAVDLTSFGVVLSKVLGGDKMTYTYLLAAIVMVFLQLGAATLPLITFGNAAIRKKSAASWSTDARASMAAVAAGASAGGALEIGKPGAAAVPSAVETVPSLLPSIAANDADGPSTEPPGNKAVVAASSDGGASLAEERADLPSNVVPLIAVPRILRAEAPSLVGARSLLLMPGDAGLYSTSSDVTSREIQELVREFANLHLVEHPGEVIASQSMWLIWQEMYGHSIARNPFTSQLSAALEDRGLKVTRERVAGGRYHWLNLSLSDEAAAIAYRLGSRQGAAGGGLAVAA